MTPATSPGACPTRRCAVSCPASPRPARSSARPTICCAYRAGRWSRPGSSSRRSRRCPPSPGRRGTAPPPATTGSGSPCRSARSPVTMRPRQGATSRRPGWTLTWTSSATTRRPHFATRAATCLKPRSPASPHSSESDMPVPIFPIPMWEQSLTLFCIIMAGVVLVCAGALAYFRRVRMERPAVGTFNARDVVILLVLIGVLPWVYGWLPVPVVTCVLVLTFASALYIGYRPMLGSVGIWLGIGLLFGLDIWSSHHVMGTIPGWQLWYTEQSIMVGLGVIAVCNLYLQGGMKLRHVAWLSLGLAFYDVLFAAYYPLTGRLLARYITHPLTPVLSMRFGEVDYAVGLGDLLVYSLFFVAAYKAYGARAAAIAAGVIVVMGGFATAFIPFLFNFSNANLDILIPAQSLFGPVAFVTYLWMKRHYGRERTMAEYLASQGNTAVAPQVEEQAPA